MNRLFLVTLIVALLVSGSIAQTSQFTYQGKLTDGASNASGPYDFVFRLFDQLENGTQIGMDVVADDLTVASGIFTATLDFGSGAFTSGGARYIEIQVRAGASSGAYTILSPRQQITASPFAIKSQAADTAATAGNALQLGGLPASQYLQTGGAPVTGDIQFTGNLLLAPAGPIAAKNGAPQPATLYAVNPAPGIANPSPTNLPPAAVRGDATSTSNSNAGVVGLANGSSGAGVVGLASGVEGTGVVALNTAATGETSGISGEILSPDGVVLDLEMPAGGSGYLIYAGSSSADLGTSRKFSVSSNGQVDINGGLNLNGTFTDGQLTISTGNLQTVGNVTANTLTATNNVSVGGFLTSPGSTIQINRDVNLNGTLTPQLLSGGNNQLCNSAPTTTLRFCTSSLRYKSHVEPFLRGMDIIRRLRPIRFNWLENGSADIGFGAEEVEQVEPILTFQNPEGRVEGVRYNQLNAVLVNALKEQQLELDKQSKIIAQQQRLLRQLTAQMRSVRARLSGRRR